MNEAAHRHFIVAGAQRSGTTSLVRMLDGHPQIAIARPLRPEPKYFLKPDALESGLEGYGRLFPDDGPAVRGEKSTSYMESEAAPRRIRRILPGVKLVFLLRDPVERAISNYWFSVRHGAETADMEEAFRREAERRDDYDRERFSVSPFAYLRRGLYAHYLDRYGRLFEKDRIKLILFERLLADAGEIRGLLCFLEVDPSVELELPPKATGGGRPPDAKVDEGLRRFLVRTFAEPNRRLAESWGLDLSPWAATREGVGR